MGKMWPIPVGTTAVRTSSRWRYDLLDNCTSCGVLPTYQESCILHAVEYFLLKYQKIQLT